MLADTATQQRDEAALRRYAPLAEAAAMRHEHRLYLAIAQRAWGVAHRLAGEYVEAGARLAQALALFQPLGVRWQTGRTLYELGELATAQGDWDIAHERFVHALADFEAMRAVHEIARTRAALAALHL
jgi:tetratricopeptide (TPR) repeat protein